MTRDVLWWAGQAVSIAIGVAIYSTYSLAAAVAVSFALAVLVDIRLHVSKDSP